MDQRKPHIADGWKLQGHPGPRYDYQRLQHHGDWAGRYNAWPLRAQRRRLRYRQPQPAPLRYQSEQPVRLGPDVSLYARPHWQCAERLQLQRGRHRADSTHGRSTLLPVLSDPGLYPGHMEGDAGPESDLWCDLSMVQRAV